MSCLVDTETSHQVEEVNYMMSRLQPGHKLLQFTQFQELASKKWEQTLELKINCT